MPKVVAYASSKGGVGKTTVAVHVAAGMAAKGKDVLLVDLDPGAHATRWLLGARPDLGVAEALIQGRLERQHVVKVEGRDMWLAPSTVALDTVEVALAKVFGRERRLAKMLAPSHFDVIVIDCPPNTGFLTQSAIYAADRVIVPVQVGVMGIPGLADIKQLVHQIREESNATVKLEGCVVFEADERKGITQRTRDRLRELAIADIFDSEIRVSTAAEELPAQRALAFDAGADPRGAEDYKALLRETERRLSR